MWYVYIRTCTSSYVARHNTLPHYSVIVSEVQAVCSLVSGQVMLVPLHSPLYGCLLPEAAGTLITHLHYIPPQSLLRP